MKEKTSIPLPNILTFSRILLGLAFIFYAYAKITFLFFLLYFLALLFDVLDGYFARRLGKATELGAKLDIIADNFILICLFTSFVFLRYTLLLNYSFQITMLFLYFLFVQAISYAVKKELIFMRTIAANVTAIVFPFVIIISFFVEAKVLIFVYIALMYYSLTEKLALKLSAENKKTIFMVKKKTLVYIFLFVVVCLTTVSAYLMFSAKSDKVCFKDGFCTKADIRDTYEGRALGLMFREEMKEDESMLFIFDSESGSSFWMKNMKLHIDIIFIDKDKKIVSISKDAFPCTKLDHECELYKPIGNYWYVVEAVSGFSDSHGLSIGQEVKFYLN
jgi:uncharacterized membrane protein (UPF0127 family)